MSDCDQCCFDNELAMHMLRLRGDCCSARSLRDGGKRMPQSRARNLWWHKLKRSCPCVEDISHLASTGLATSRAEITQPHFIKHREPGAASGESCEHAARRMVIATLTKAYSSRTELWWGANWATCLPAVDVCARGGVYQERGCVLGAMLAGQW